MNRSAQSSSKSHHQVGAGAPNLPFGIDHILSSSSAGSPMKQVQQAMASIDHQSLHFNLQQQQQQQQHLNHQQLSHFQQQQQQAAAMQLMLSSAGLPGAPNLAPGNPSRPAPDFMSGASLNEQLALLAAASQHQQQQQQQLLNPGALAAAAQAQQHLQWQYQQQQLMSAATAAAAAAAAAAASQHRQAADSLAGLGPLGGALSSLNALAAQSQNLSDTPTTASGGGVGSTSPTTNHLLSCFMASMLLQQQQQQQAQKQASQQHQQQQHHNAREHLHHDALAGGHMAPFLPAASQQQRLPLSSAGPLCHFGNHADLSAPVGGQQRRSPSTSTTSTSSPIKQFLGDKNHSPSAQEQHHVDFNSLNRFGAADAHHSPLSSSATTTTTTARHPNDSGKPASKGCKPLAAPKASQQHAKVAPSSSALVAGARPPTGASSTNSSNNNNHDATDADDECGAGTALSSLSNFVSKSLAPILDEFNSNLGKQQQRASAGQRTLMAAAGHQSRHAKASNNGSISSGSDSSMIDDVEANANHQRKLVASARGANGGNEDNILKAVATALKGAATNPANSIGEPKTINTAIARAPPELVQKQPAWVFCTRYSDRPSSGPRTRRAKSKDKKPRDTKLSADEKRPRTAFTSEQLEKLRLEFQANSYLDEKRRKSLADRLCLNENQIKIWFQNKRAKMKKQSNQPNPLRGLLVAGGLYNHSTATSDCSESYANGQADDVGNRAIRDFEQEGADGDENDEEEDGEDALLLNSDDDENGRADENGRRGSSELKPGRVEQAQRHHNHSIENLTRDELNDKQRQATTGGGCGARSGNNEPLKRARASVEGEDERNNNSDLNGNGSSPCSAVNPLKRAKLDQQAGGSPASNLGKDLVAADEPVISVS